MNRGFFNVECFSALLEMPEHILYMLMMTEISRVDFQLSLRLGLTGQLESLMRFFDIQQHHKSSSSGHPQLPQNQQVTGHPHPLTQSGGDLTKLCQSMMTRTTELPTQTAMVTQMGIHTPAR